MCSEYINIDITTVTRIVRLAIQHIKKELPDTFVIAGNAKHLVVRELKMRADAAKVWIGPGKVCINKVKTDLVQVVGITGFAGA